MKHVKPSIWIVLMLPVMGMLPVLSALADEGQEESIKTLFHRYCQDCHGSKMDGRGALRPFLEQAPADLTSQNTQAKTDQELFAIIKDGGGVEMHGWADTLSDEQILGLVRYLRVVVP